MPDDTPRRDMLPTHASIGDAHTVAPPGTVVQGAAGGTAPHAAPGPRRLAVPPGYEVLGELGRGGMGVVFRARQVALDRVVALKMILAGGLAGPAERARFEAEAKAVAAFQHPNIVQVFETGEADGNPYLALEFCPGGGLDSIARAGAVESERAAELVREIARGVGAAHRRGIVHRDLKPHNVLLAEDGTPKVTDFGLAKKLDAADGLTVTGAVMGTPAYMAPEQASGKTKEVGPAADVYALGAILYELLTGRPPFRADSVFDTLQMVVNAEPTAPRRFAPGLPVDLETVVLKCLEKDPRKRYAAADALADDLDRFLAGEPVSARRVGRGERAVRFARRHRVAVGLSAVAAALLIGLVAVAMRSNRTSPPADAPPGDATPDDVVALVEELDKSDPGWRIEQMDKARKVIPPAANSATLIEATVAALPPDFNARLTRFTEMNGKLPPTAPLPPEFRLTKDPGWLRTARATQTARQLADRPFGRFPLNWNWDAFQTLLPHVQRPREATALLQWDAISEASAGKFDVALTDCRAMVNAGRSLHDEPTSISQLVRIACGTMAVQTAQRVLALGPAPEKELKALADALRDEDAAPVFLIMVRAERGSVHRTLANATSGDMPDPAPGTPQDEIDAWNRIPKGPPARTAHVWALRHITELVAIAKRPPHEQPAAISEWEDVLKRDGPPGTREVIVAAGKIGDASRRYQTILRSTLAAFAAERYRIDTEKWPESLAVLVPEYLPAVPLDPQDGRPLRFQRLPDGLVVYGVGPDGKDDGGAIAPPASDQSPPDAGFRLWDADRRGKSPNTP